LKLTTAHSQHKNTLFTKALTKLVIDELSIIVFTAVQRPHSASVYVNNLFKTYYSIFKLLSSQGIQNNMYMSLITLATTLLFTINSPIQAHSHKSTTELGDLIISNTWARTTPRTAKTGVAYFVIKNRGKADDTLVGVTSEIAKKTEIHQSSEKNNIMHMRHVGKVNIPAGSVAELRPNSFHIMFMGLHAPIKQGDIFPLTLTFKTAGTVKVMVKASKAAEKSSIDHNKMKTK
jgi:copper(I)-binding protein